MDARSLPTLLLATLLLATPLAAEPLHHVTTLGSPTEHAIFLPEGTTLLEAGYGIGHRRSAQLHTLHGRASLTLAEQLDVRLGWDVFGISLPTSGPATYGVGDLYLQGRFGLPVDRRETHRLALLATFRPGIGQAPVSVDGVLLGGGAVYTLQFPDFRVDTQATLDIEIGGQHPRLTLPLSGRISYALPNAARVLLFAELMTTVRAANQTDVGAGIHLGTRFAVSPDLALGLSIGGALGGSLPTAALALTGAYTFGP